MINKKIIIVFLVFVILLLFTIDVSAVDYDSAHYVDIQREGGYYIDTFRICCYEDFYLYDRGNGYWSTYAIGSDKVIPCSVYKNGEIQYGGEVPGGSVLSNQFVSGKDEVVDSAGTVFIYKDTTKTDTFFHQAPLLVEILMPERGAMRTVLQEIVNILPMILVVVVCYLGLRKAWSILSHLLQKA